MSAPHDPNPHGPNSYEQYPSQSPPADQSYTAATPEERQRLAQEAARQTKTRKSTALDKFVGAVIYLVAALEILLTLRFMLRLTGANPDNTFARVIYDLSQPFVDPFSTLFISPTFGGSQNIFDVNLLVAMSAYLALLALFLGLIRVLFDR
ncbi:MAG: YggT family protein [Leptolyngbyaceae cyanobacterium]